MLILVKEKEDQERPDSWQSSITKVLIIAKSERLKFFREDLFGDSPEFVLLSSNHERRKPEEILML